MTDYILLQCKKAKCPLLSMRGKAREYTLRYGGVLMTMNYYLEAWMATVIFSNNRAAAVDTIRLNIPDAGPDEIDGLIDTFIKKHPLTPVPHYYYEDIPLMAIDNYYFEIHSSMFSMPVKLTAAQEQEVLDILISPRIYDKMGNLRQWFCNYRTRYGIEARLKRDRAGQDDELVWAFLYSHGISSEPPLMDKRHAPTEGEKALVPISKNTKRKNFKYYLTKILLFPIQIILVIVGLGLIGAGIGLLGAAVIALFVGALLLFQYCVCVNPAVGMIGFTILAAIMALCHIGKYKNNRTNDTTH